MLPNTGVANTIIGLNHVQHHGLSRNDLQHPPVVDHFTAYSSLMGPALGSFTAQVTPGSKTASTWIDIYENVLTPLLPVDTPIPNMSLHFTSSTRPSQAREYFLWKFQDVLVTKEKLKTRQLYA